MTVEATTVDYSTLAAASEAVAPLAPAARELHAAVLIGAMGQVLADHLVAFARQLPDMDMADAPAVARATAGLISACQALSGGASGPRAAEPASTARICRFIDDNLQSEELTPARICEKSASRARR